MNMGMTSDNVVEKFGIDRLTMDKFAVESHRKAANAQKNGWSQREITPYKTKVLDKDGEEQEVVVDRDDGVRPNSTVESLAKLKGAFKKGGLTTAGNSSQTTDGAAVCIVARRSTAKKHGLPIVGRILSYGVASVPPEIMGVGPAYAIPIALKNAGLKMEDIEVFEINEAFASQAHYCI